MLRPISALVGVVCLAVSLLVPISPVLAVDEGPGVLRSSQPAGFALPPVKKLVASDAESADAFGWAVAVSGDIALVGVRMDDDACTNDPLCESGAVFVFERDFGGPDNWGEVTKLTASDADAGDEFGFAVAIDGTTAVVGVRLDDDDGNDSGSAYVFERDFGGPGNWGEVMKLRASDAAPGDNFGKDVAISGDTLVVSAYFTDDLGDEAGSAYIFQRNSGNPNQWDEVREVTAFEGGAADEFGIAVSLDGDVLVVGSWLDDDACPQDPECNSGSAHVYERNAGGPENWGQVAELRADDHAAGDSFGFDVAVSGDTIAVGAFQEDGAGTDSGSVYVYERVPAAGSPSWTQVAKLVAADLDDFDVSGFSLSLSGDTLVSGAWLNDDACPTDVFCDSGSAHVFRRTSPGRWEEVTKLLAPDAAIGDVFGFSVSVQNDTVVCSAWLDDDACPGNPSCDSGSAYVFELAGLIFEDGFESGNLQRWSTTVAP